MATVVFRDYAFNVKRSNTYNYKRALERPTYTPVATSSGANSTGLWVGDSTTVGAGVANNAANWTDSDRANCYGRRFGDLTRKMLVDNVETGSALGDKIQSNGDPRVVLGAGWDANGLVTLGGKCIRATSTAAVSTWTFEKAFDSVDVYYVKNTGLGTFDLKVDGGAATSVNCNASAVVGKTSKAVAGTAVTIQQTAGTDIEIIGVIPRYTKKCFYVLNGGRGGSTAVDNAIATDPWSPLNMVTYYAADFTVINLGINDMNNSLDLVNATIPALQSLITAAKTSGDAILVVPHPCSTASISAVTQSTYAGLLYALASNNDIPLIDFQKLFIDYTTANAQGVTTDQLHYNWLGYQREAQALFAALNGPWL